MASFLLLLSILVTTSSVLARYTVPPGFDYKGGCGQYNYGDGFKIIDGLSAKPCQFPWMGLLVYYLPSKATRTGCGASIVNKWFILTAAHCINGKTDRFAVRTGGLYKWAHYTEYKIAKRIYHPKYRYADKLYRNDIALMKLEKPIKFDACHVPVCLNTDVNVDNAVNLTCMISGWGATRSWGSSKLLWAYDKILTRDACNDHYDILSTNYTLCGRATADGNPGFCSGDSGGPLVCKHEEDGRYYQHGVVSLYGRGTPCATEGLYTNVASYYQWINETIQK